MTFECLMEELLPEIKPDVFVLAQTFKLKFSVNVDSVKGTKLRYCNV